MESLLASSLSLRMLSQRARLAGNLRHAALRQEAAGGRRQRLLIWRMTFLSKHISTGDNNTRIDYAQDSSSQQALCFREYRTPEQREMALLDHECWGFLFLIRSRG